MSHADTPLRGTSALGGAVGGLWLLRGFLLSEQALGPCGQRCAMADPPLARHAGSRQGTGGVARWSGWCSPRRDSLQGRQETVYADHAWRLLDDAGLHLVWEPRDREGL